MTGKAREYSLKRLYGITPEQYQELLDRQGGVCAICSKSPEEEGRSLAVDHDHKSREIRGLLCCYCNRRVVGRHRDSNLLQRMAEYVDRTTGWFVPVKKRRRKTTRKVKKVGKTRGRMGSGVL